MPIGITILTTMPYPESLDSFIFLVYNISIYGSNAECEIYTKLTFSEIPNNNDSVVFVIPYNIENCEVLHSPYVLRSSLYYNQDLDCSFITIYPQPEMGNIFEVIIYFRWVNCLRWTSYDMFDLIVSFGFSDIRIIQSNWSGNIIDPPNFPYARISISDPSDCRPILYNPLTNKVHTFEGRIWNSWIVDISIDPKSPPLASVRVEYLSEALADEKDYRVFIAGALLGTGISVFINSFTTLEKRKRDLKIENI